MTPLEAWSIISGNLAHLVRIRRCQGDPKGYVEADTEAEVIAYKALREMQDRMYTKPLTFEELIQMDGEPVWLNMAGGIYGLVDAPDRCVWLDHGGWCSIGNVTGKAYRYKPAEVNDDV